MRAAALHGSCLPCHSDCTSGSPTPLHCNSLGYCWPLLPPSHPTLPLPHLSSEPDPVIFPQGLVPSLLFLMGIRFKSSACTAKFLQGVPKKPDTSIPITTAHIVRYIFLRQILFYFIIFYFKIDYMILTQLFGHLN